MRNKFYGELFPVNLLVAIGIIFVFTAFISRFFPTSPRTLEIERLLVQ